MAIVLKPSNNKGVRGAVANGEALRPDIPAMDTSGYMDGGMDPPKANAAPSISKNIAVGLINALNKQEDAIIKSGAFKKANVYSIEFAPASLGDARVTKEGTPNKAKTPMQNSKNPSDKVNPKSNSASYDVRTYNFSAGTPVVVILDSIMKNSSYITDQANLIIDEVTGKPRTQKPLGDLAWYNISVQTTPIGFDTGRNDYVYNIKYVISAYGLSDMNSEFFPPARLRGRHKSYKYWFTGQNTQVLRFEQSFNKLYAVTFTNPQTLAVTRAQTNHRESPVYVYQAAAGGSSSQGAEGKANAIGASAADYLYSPTDIANCTIGIIGDPAWIQQGVSVSGIDSLNYNFHAFEPDGSINYDAQEIIFDLQWNPSVDYDVNKTGLANPNVSSTPQAIYTYKASHVISKFSKGKFEQELTGVLVQLPTALDKTKVAGTTSNDDTGDASRAEAYAATKIKGSGENQSSAETSKYARFAEAQRQLEIQNRENLASSTGEFAGMNNNGSSSNTTSFLPATNVRQPDVNEDAGDPEAQNIFTVKDQ